MVNMESLHRLLKGHVFAILSSLCCFLPLIIGFKISFSDESSSIFLSAMSSFDIDRSIFCTISAVAPFYMDVLFDFLTTKKANIWSIASRSAIVSALLLSSVLTYFYLAYQQKLHVLPSIFYARELYLAHIVYNYLNKFGSPIWDTFVVKFIVITITILSISKCFILFFEGNICRILNFVIISLGCLVTVIIWLHCYKWYFYVKDKAEDNMNFISYEIQCCSNFAIVLFFYPLAMWVLFFTFGRERWQDTSLAYFMSTIYLELFVVIIVLFLNGRALRKDVSLTQVCVKKLNISKNSLLCY